MHRCLLVDEILSNIFELLVDRRKDLAALAQTCRAFDDPALDVLWRNVDDFSILIKYTVPARLWREEETSLTGSQFPMTTKANIIVSCGNPLPSDWNRFFFYASRVRSIGVGDAIGTKPAIDPLVFHKLCLYRPLSPLLPGLHSLHWVHDNRDTLPYINIFLGPSIRNIHLSFWPTYSSDNVATTLAWIQDKCPSLQRLEMYDMTDSASVASAIAHSCGVFQGLRILCLSGDSFDHQAIVYLAKLPFLEDLWLSVGWLKPAELEDVVLSTATPSFPALKHLDVKARDDVIHEFLGLIQLAPLESLSIRWPYSPGADDSAPFSLPPLLRTAFKKLQFLHVTVPDLAACSELLSHIQLSALQELHIQYKTFLGIELDKFFEILPECCSPSALKTLSLVIKPTPMMGYHCISNAALRPLMAFKNLENISLEPGCAFALEDSLIEDLAKAWEGLDRIVIKPCYPLGTMSKLTLACLVPLAQHCPGLTHIELPLTRDISPSSVPVIGHEYQNRSVRTVFLDGTRLSQDAVSVTDTFLSCLFPDLKDFEVN